jgi:precorrin-6Y C5,15-methyltransferase (decarboxylating)
MTEGITVIGMAGGGIDGARPSERARQALRAATVVVGAARHLEAAAQTVPPSCERIALGPLEPALERLRAAGSGVVLASGDPGFFGIVRRLRAEGFDPQVEPAPSSVATAFARLGLAWDGAVVVSAHGRDPRTALNACRAVPLAAVLTEPGAGAAELAGGLVGWDRRVVVAERLGEADERVVELTAAEAAEREWRHPHMLISIAPAEGGTPVPAQARDGDGPRADNQPAAAPAAGWALPESAYLHRDSMITKAEVRALVVARLRPRLGRLVWDVGAGSGSIGIECAALGAAVVAVDDDPSACELVRANASSHRVGHAVRVEAGRAPAALDQLPDPDAVFVGGGGPQTVAAVAARGPERVVVALAALDRVAPTVAALRAGGFVVDGVQLSASRLGELPDGSLRLIGTNPVVVLVGERT